MAAPSNILLNSRLRCRHKVCDSNLWPRPAYIPLLTIQIVRCRVLGEFWVGQGEGCQRFCAAFWLIAICKRWNLASL